MSQSTQKPRPRPRPRPRNAESSSEVDGIGSSSKSPVPDEDAMFMRNRNRSANAWTNINSVVNKREATRNQSEDPGSSDSDSPRSKRLKREPFAPKSKKPPAWTRYEGLIDIKDSDSESGSEGGSCGEPAEASMTEGTLEQTPRTKRKKESSRSRSSSPSLQAVALAEQFGRERARQVLAIKSMRNKTPVHVSDDEDVEELGDLPDELAAIKAEITRNSTRPESTEGSTSTMATVDINILVRPHPEDESGRTYNYSLNMYRNEKFEQLFDEIADAAGIPSNRLVVLYNNQRVYPWSTPRTFSIWSKAELVVYEEHVYKYIKARERTASPVYATTCDAPTTTETTADYGAESDASQDKSNTFKLQVRLGEAITTVTVRATTKCSSIVKSVLQKLGKPASATNKARIVVDGEKLSPESEIGEADLEDGDLVDVVGA